MLNHRLIQPEILDSLPADDPSAIRSRSDLRRINWFMGNKRWLRHQIEAITQNSSKPLQIVELGSGDGSFLIKLSEKQNHRLIGIDLAPRPRNLPDGIEWICGDIFEIEKLPFLESHTSVIVCNLILHHFTDEQLTQLGELFSEADHILAVEPLRTRVPLLLGRLAYPLVNYVTRHDMIASIKAGFRKQELHRHFIHHDIVSEETSQRGSIRLHLSQPNQS